MKKFTRREFIGSTAVAFVAGPSLLIATVPALAGDTPAVDPDDSQAKALSYVHVSPKADANCANCRLYTGSADAEWGPCAIFPGKQVAGAGWCSAWVEQSG